MKQHIWTIKTTHKARDCARCREFITAGLEVYERTFGDETAFFCLPCGDKLSSGASVAITKALPHRSKRQRRPGDPLLGPGHVVHGLGRMGA